MLRANGDAFIAHKVHSIPVRKQPCSKLPSASHRYANRNLGGGGSGGGSQARVEAAASESRPLLSHSCPLSTFSSIFRLWVMWGQGKQPYCPSTQCHWVVFIHDEIHSSGALIGYLGPMTSGAVTDRPHRERWRAHGFPVANSHLLLAWSWCTWGDLHISVYIRKTLLKKSGFSLPGFALGNHVSLGNRGGKLFHNITAVLMMMFYCSSWLCVYLP